MQKEAERLNCDLCVIGGGMAGICAAVSAARLGLSVILVHDRNVLGGNASSEVRMWIRGAGKLFPGYAEGGILEELALDNMYYNPNLNYSVWDGVLYNKVISEKNITLLLGATCVGAEYDGRRIKSICAWQLQSYRRYEVEATYFADCSGDCVLAEFISIPTMIGRESMGEFGETLAPEMADDRTMGNTCMLQLRKGKSKIEPPFPFEEDISELIGKRIGFSENNWEQENFWWLEFGGDDHALKNASRHNQTALKMAFSAYHSIKGKLGKDFPWSLDWVGFLAGKRETRRYRGDYVLTANDLLAGKNFDDEIAYGGWSMDVHDARGLYAESANKHYFPKSPYAIPYRCIYSSDIGNLFFAGRNISATHLALSSTRVMGTCAMLGQAVGTACAVAKRYGLSPHDAGDRIEEIQQRLLQNDCFLLHTSRKGILSNSTERCIAGGKRIALEKGERRTWEFSKRDISYIRIVFDSDFERKFVKDPMLKLFPMLCYNGSRKTLSVPPTLVRSFVVRWRTDNGWHEKTVGNNFQRLVRIEIGEEADAIEFHGLSTYGAKKIYLWSLDIE